MADLAGCADGRAVPADPAVAAVSVVTPRRLHAGVCTAAATALSHRCRLLAAERS